MEDEKWRLKYLKQEIKDKVLELWLEGLTFSEIGELMEEKEGITKQRAQLVIRSINTYKNKGKEHYFQLMKRKYENKTVNNVLILEIYPKKENKRRKCLCQCECGNTFETLISRILSKSTKSCGCFRGNCGEIKIGSEHPHWRGHGGLSLHLYHRYKNGAIARKLEFSITIEYMWNLFLKQERKCVLTGQPLKFGLSTNSNIKETTASLDRIENNIGYIEGNVQWIHKDINRLKNNYSADKFWNMISKIYLHKQNINTDYQI